MRRVKTIWERLRNQKEWNNDNLHRIAISNLDDFEKGLIRWWCKKYRRPPKPLGDYTVEEIFLEQLEDFYDANPVEIDRFLANEQTQDYGWNGQMSKEYELAIAARLKRINERNRVNVEKYKDDKPLTPEQEQEILNNLGRNLPKSKLVTKKEDGSDVEFLGSGDIDEEFGG